MDAAGQGVCIAVHEAEKLAASSVAAKPPPFGEVCRRGPQKAVLRAAWRRPRRNSRPRDQYVVAVVSPPECAGFRDLDGVGEANRPTPGMIKETRQDATVKGASRRPARDLPILRPRIHRFLDALARIPHKEPIGVEGDSQLPAQLRGQMRWWHVRWSRQTIKPSVRVVYG